MHVVLAALVAALVIYLLYRMVSAPAAPAGDTTGARSDRGFAFVSNGLIFLRERGAEVQQVHSTYAQEAADRRERARERHSWKQGTSFRVSAGGGVRDFEPADKPAIVYSNGRGVFVLEKDGSSRIAATQDLVGEVVAAAG